MQATTAGYDMMQSERIWGWASVNRRAIDIDGKSSLGLNPDGAVDRRIGLLRIEKENGDPLVLIAN